MSMNDSQHPKSKTASEPLTEVQSTGDVDASVEVSIPRHVQQHPDAPRITGYVLTETLGQGAYGQVWRAWHLRTRAEVAVKIFLQRVGLDWIFLQRDQDVDRQNPGPPLFSPVFLLPHSGFEIRDVHDLRCEGQTDEDEMGFTYPEVDALLHLWVDRRYPRVELEAAGFALEFIDRVQGTVRRNQYKRRPPVIAKVANRTVNLDYRYARDWGA